MRKTESVDQVSSNTQFGLIGSSSCPLDWERKVATAIVVIIIIAVADGVALGVIWTVESKEFVHVGDARRIFISSEHRAFFQPVAKITISLVICIFQQKHRFESILFNVDVIGCGGLILNDPVGA